MVIWVAITESEVKIFLTNLSCGLYRFLFLLDYHQPIPDRQNAVYQIIILAYH